MRFIPNIYIFSIYSWLIRTLVILKKYALSAYPLRSLFITYICLNMGCSNLNQVDSNNQGQGVNKIEPHHSEGFSSYPTSSKTSKEGLRHPAADLTTIYESVKSLYEESTVVENIDLFVEEFFVKYATPSSGKKQAFVLNGRCYFKTSSIRNSQKEKDFTHVRSVPAILKMRTFIEDHGSGIGHNTEFYVLDGISRDGEETPMTRLQSGDRPVDYSYGVIHGEDGPLVLASAGPYSWVEIPRLMGFLASSHSYRVEVCQFWIP